MPPTIFKVICFVLSFCSLEVFALFLFKWVRNTFIKTDIKKEQKADWSVLKGLIERCMLLLGFVASIPTIIVFFGAIKLGTRFKESTDSKISNDYFLIGNVMSAIVVLLEYLFFQLISK